jgi:hypothetical protein
MPAGAAAGKKITGGTSHLPVGAQELEQVRRKHEIAIFLALSQFDPDHHALRIDVSHAQGGNLGNLQARGIGGYENGLVLEVGKALEEA